MLLGENKPSIKLCPSTIMRDLRWNKQKTIQISSFQAHFGRLLENEFKILRDKFINNYDYLDKQHLERSALTSSRPKRRVNQCQENLKNTSPLYKQQVQSDWNRQRAKAFKELLEANARWNEERRDAAKKLSEE